MVYAKHVAYCCSALHLIFLMHRQQPLFLKSSVITPLTSTTLYCIIGTGIPELLFLVYRYIETCCSLSSSFTKLCCNCGTFPPAHSRIYPTWRLRLPGWALSKNTLWISSWTSSQTKDTSFRFFLNSTMIFWKAPWRTATKARWRWIELLLLWRLPLLLWKQVTSWPLPGLRCNRT